MADLSTKKDPLHLKEEAPSDVEDVSGQPRQKDPSEGEPGVGGDPEDSTPAAGDGDER